MDNLHDSNEPVAWMPIEQMYPQAKAIDILMGDGSILCAVLPQFDGDLWWEGSGTGEKFIDPKYANVTHWRIHDERTSPQPAPATELREQQEPYGQVTVVRRPGCVDQHWFYRWPEPPYLDNAAECYTVYTSPPASKPWVGLTDEEVKHEWEVWRASMPRYAGFAKGIEAKLREKNA